MRKIFIAFADDNMAYSLKRIGRLARKMNVFDEVILYTPAVLPDYIRKSPLMQYKRGSGYWAWKPAIIMETLARYDEGDVVVYVDAGCTLKKMPEWTLYFELLKKYDTICFQYRDEMPVWRKFGQVSTKIKYWTKKSTLLYFDELLQTTKYRDFNKVLATFLLCRGKDNLFVKSWLGITLQHPELVIDPTEEELAEQYEGFAFHKHDQSIITPLAYHYSSVMVLPELCETCGEKVAVQASRIRAANLRQYLVLCFKLRLRLALGNSLFDFIKKHMR